MIKNIFFSKEHPSISFLISGQMFKIQNAAKKKTFWGKGYRQENDKYMTSSKISFFNEDHRNVPWLIAITLICTFDEFYALAWEL